MKTSYDEICSLMSPAANITDVHNHTPKTRCKLHIFITL